MKFRGEEVLRSGLMVSQVLYVKNLASTTAVEDLAGVFSCFERPEKERITYKFMGGRMHGQAFVFFPGNIMLNCSNPDRH